MKAKKLLSMLLALCLVLSCIPVMAGAEEAVELEAKQWPSDNVISENGSYTIPESLNTKVSINSGVTDVKLVGNAANTAANPYSGLYVLCQYSDLNLTIEGLYVTSTSNPVLEFVGTGYTLTVEGDNAFTGYSYGSAALVELNANHYSNNYVVSELTITGTGKLSLTQPGSTYGAAIGGEAGAACGTLVIEGAEIDAVTEGYGAAIGGGNGGNAPSITINGGTVTANSHYAMAGWSYNQNYAGAAIGGGNGASGGTNSITINGGTVTATTSTNSAAIGGSLYTGYAQGTETNNITINGGKVYAYSLNEGGTATSGGAAIGSAYCGGDASITINGGEVIAVTETAAAAIGSGAGGSYYVSKAAVVTVNGGTVSALANSSYSSDAYRGPAIGKGCYSENSQLIINAGAVLGEGGASKNINATITNSDGESLTEVILEIPGVKSLSIGGVDWKVSANHADFTDEGGKDYGEEVHVWLVSQDTPWDMAVGTEDGTKNYELWASGVMNEYHSVTYGLTNLDTDGPDRVYDPSAGSSWNEDLKGKLIAAGSEACAALPESISVTVDGQAVDFTYNANTGAFQVDSALLTGDVVITAEGTVSHTWVDASCTGAKHCSVCGETEGEALGHDYVNGKCTRCGAGDPDYVAGITRIYGDNRYSTAIKAADEMKEVLGLEKFDTIILASGTNFADALSGSYLAAKRNAPILLSGSEKYDQLAADYIKANLAENGTVYVLGGTKAVSENMEAMLDGYNVQRLAGADRYETNILILKEAGVHVDQTVLVCTGSSFADSLSASATGAPILLVRNEKGELMDCQKEFLAAYYGAYNGGRFRMVGGYKAISYNMEKAFRDYGSTDRVFGADRYETSAELAKLYFGNSSDQAVLAYAKNFPDGLCGGALAYAMNAPLILTATGNEAAAVAYAEAQGITSGIVLGGGKLISDDSVRVIFAMETDAEIIVK